MLNCVILSLQYYTLSFSQVHAAVSGALDRLHYEKDPCVKYDSSKKVWVYLHRNRTRDEFGMCLRQIAILHAKLHKIT